MSATRVGPADIFLNPSPHRLPVDDGNEVASWEWHRGLPGYQPTPLRHAPELARQLGLARVWVKDESERCGLPSFKVLGAAYATARTLSERLGHKAETLSVDELRAALAAERPITLAAATDGNHGRAVAYIARVLGIKARILVPTGTARARIAAIAAEGAQVDVIDGSYDDAVATVARLGDDSRCVVISDTALHGHDRVPRFVMDGYRTIFAEIDDQGADPDLVLIQIGVGGLAAAAALHWPSWRPMLVGVEPVGAACALAALRAGEPKLVPGPHRSIMAGLNCGLVSRLAFPLLRERYSAVLSIDDETAREAMRDLAAEGIVAGETGAAGLAGLAALMGDIEACEALGVGRGMSALVVNTEGATDPEQYARIVPRDGGAKA